MTLSRAKTNNFLLFSNPRKAAGESFPGSDFLDLSYLNTAVFGAPPGFLSQAV